MAKSKTKPKWDFDFGNGYVGRKVGWHPDRELNPQYDGIPDNDFTALILKCGPHDFEGAVSLDRGIPGQRKPWTVLSEDPLTLDPSIQAQCGCHGYIREGRWVSA